MYTQEAVYAFLATIKHRDLMPRQLEVSQLGGTFIVNAFDDPGTEVITNKVNTGVSADARIALMKAVVERLERQALIHFLSIDANGSYRKHKSDGMAAFPKFGDTRLAADRARENAFSEALERFAWASWWDNDEINASIHIVDRSSPLMSESVDCWDLIQNVTPLEKLYAIQPGLSDDRFEVFILFGALKTGGWISGGAAGRTGDSANTVFRGMSEMMRHSLAFQRMSNDGIEPKSFYEKRLWYFASGAGNDHVAKRMSRVGSSSLALPPVMMDQPIEHPHQDILAVHRVLFQEQPPFVSGDLERLCL